MRAHFETARARATKVETYERMSHGLSRYGTT